MEKSSIKIYLIIAIICSIFFVGTVKADDKNIVVEDAKIIEKSGTINVVDPTVSSNSINGSIVFNEQDDFVTYEIVLKNNEEDNYKIDAISDNNKVNNLEISYEYSEDYINAGDTTIIKVKLKYTKKIINSNPININDLTIKISLSNDKGEVKGVVINNPKTGDSIFMYLFILIVAFIGLLLLIKKVNYKKVNIGIFVLIIALLMVPLTIIGSEQYEVKIYFDSIELKSEYEKYTVIIDSQDGSTPEEREVTYGDPIGNLPNIPDKDGYDKDSWKDQNGNPVNENTPVTGPITITPKYDIIHYNINYTLDGGLADNPTTYTIEDEITLNNPTKDGYTFAGWTGSNGNQLQTRVTINRGSTGDKEYVANYSVNQDTPYTVIHRYEKLTSGYDENIEYLNGPTDTEVTPSLKVVTGFTTPDTKTVKIKGDGTTSVTYTYNRIKYTLNIQDRTYLTSGSTANGNYKYGTTITLEAKNRPGYSFKWSDLDTNYSKTFTIDNDYNLSLIYTANTDTAYVVNHYQMNLDGTTYTLKDTHNGTATTDTEVTPAVNTYTGFISPSVKTETVKGDGSTVIDYYYTREKYQVSFEDKQYINENVTDGEYYYGYTINISAKERDGFTFVNWSNGSTNSNLSLTVTEPVSLRPVYDPKGDTLYTVYHKKMNLDGTTYTLEETDSLHGTTGIVVQPETKTYEGFTSPERQNLTILGDGSASIEYLYTRNKYDVVIDNSGNTITDSVSGQYYYGEQISVEAKNRPGYDFTSWSNGDTNQSTTITVDGPTEIIPVYIAKTNTPYVVNHYQMNLDGETYTLYESQDLTGTTDTEVTPSVKNYTGFTSPSAQTTQINGNGNTVVDYYYSRNKVNVVLSNKEYINTTLTDGKHYYGESYTLTVINKPGYDFVKWSNNDTNNTINITLTDDLNIGPVFTARDDTLYIVNHKKMNTDGTTYTTYETENLYGTTDTQVTPDVKTYAGFVSPNTQTKNINGAETTVFDYLYERTKVLVTVQNKEYINTTATTKEYYYGEELHFEAIDRPGYDFVKWSNDYADQSITITVTEPITIYPIYTERDDTKYTVIHKQMNLDGETYTTVETEELSGTTNAEVTPGVKTYVGFTAPSTQTKTIKADGTTVFEYKYTRNKYDLVVNNYNDVVEGNKSGKYYYETQITLTAKDKTGHTFIKWSNDDSNKSTTITILSDTTIEPIYDVNTFKITFDTNGGTVEKIERVIEEGASVGELPTPIREGYYLIGWFTGISEGTQIDGTETPDHDITYYARWKKSVSSMIISNPEIELEVGNEEVIDITNKNEIEEEFTFTSSDPTVATVDEDGKVVGIKEGTTTITITGTDSNETKTVEVTVVAPAPAKITIKFDSQGGNTIADRVIDEGSVIGSLPTPIREGYYLIGWFTGISEGTQIDGTETPDHDITYYARWKKSVSSMIISNPEIELEVGNEEVIDITNKNEIEEEFTFTSSDPTVATVDEDGKVVGIKEGTTTITITGTDSNETKTVEVTVVNTQTNKIAVHFDTQGGSPEPDMLVDPDTTISRYPEPTKDDYIFKGWYTDTSYVTKVDTSTVISSEVTFYARWALEVFPDYFYHAGACTFNGSEVNITGDDCKDYWDKKYIDTLVPLYSETNAAKDYEIYFEIDSYDGSQQDSGSKQNVFVNAKYENSSLKWPGLVFRREDGSTTSVELTQTIQGTKATKKFTAADVHSVRIVRKNKVIYYSINGDDFVELQNTSNFTQYFDVTTWFGAAPDASGTPMRHLKATLSHMYVKLGTMPQSEFAPDAVNVNFDANGGTVSPTTKPVGQGKKVGTLPTPTKTDFIFDGWYTNLTDAGIKIDENYIINEEVTFYAKWKKSAEFSNISEPSMMMIVGEEKDIFVTNIDEIGEDITYISSDPSVASVDSEGNITALSVGNSTITLKGNKSNKYRTANVFVETGYYTVTLTDANGNLIETRAYTGGQTLGELPELTKNPNNSRQIMKGWYDDKTYTNKVTEDTVVNSDMNLYTKWTKIVSECTLRSIWLVPGEVDTVGYAYNDDCEDIVMSDYENDGTYGITGTPDGVVTALGVDADQKTYSYKITGLSSGTVVDRTIRVEKPYFYVTYESYGGTYVDKLKVRQDSTIGDLPTDITKYGYNFGGWYIDDEFTTEANSSMVVTKDITLYAKWDSYPECAGHQHVTIVDSALCENNQNLVTPDGTICRRAKVLHEEQCTKTNGSYCSGAGYTGKNIPYGNCGTDGQLNVGDAFTCDVNGDGNFDELYERFYYVSDYYNTSTRTFENDTASLVYYSNIYNGRTCNTQGSVYNLNFRVLNGPTGAIDELPTTAEWSNVGLKYNYRTLLSVKNETSSSYGSRIDYTGHAARLLNAAEVIHSCGVSFAASEEYSDYFNTCMFLGENTNFSGNTNITRAYWLENAYVKRYYEAWGIYSSSNYNAYEGLRLSTYYVENDSNKYGVRPVIDIPKNKIAYGQNENDKYYITFDTNGGLENTSYVGVTKGSAVGSVKDTTPAPGKIFIGWFTDVVDGIRIGNDYVPESDITVYARYEVLTDSTYTVTFESNGGTSVDSRLVNKDTRVGTIPEPSRENYMFDGWYSDSEFTTKVDSRTIVSSDVTYYAKWLKTIALSSFPDVIEVHSGDSIDVTFDSSSFDEEYSNYGIKNSKVATYTSSNGVWTIKGVAEGETYISFKGNKSNKYKYITIKVLPPYYTLSFNTQGGDPIESQRYVKGTKVYEVPTPHREGYAFVIWGDDTYFHYDLILPIKMTYNNTLYAKWKRSVSVAEFAYDNFNLVVNDTAKIVVKNLVSIEEGYHYESLDENVATIDKNGVIVAKSPGTTKVRMVGEIDGLYKEATVNVTDIVTKHTLSFESNGGTAVDSMIIEDGKSANELPVPEKKHYNFVGWYTDTTYSTQITSTTPITSDMILYARWNYANFPIVYKMNGRCEFDSGRIDYATGDCKKYYNQTYLDTGVKLYDEENYLNDYEISFDITNIYNITSPTKQTIVNTKLESNNYPGVVLRYESSGLELSSKKNSSQQKVTTDYSSLSHVRIVRDNEQIYYSFNNQSLELLQNVKGFTQFFDLPVWFGAAPDSEGNPQRFLQHAYIDNIIIRKGDFKDINRYRVYFDVKGGTLDYSTRYYDENAPFGELPTPTRSGYVFKGWYLDAEYNNKVNEDYVPTANTTLYAKWFKAIDGAKFNSLTGYYNEDQKLVVTGLNTVEEPYEFTSSNTSIATIDENLMVHGVAKGSTTIVFVGLETGRRVSVNVTINYRTNKIKFDSQGGTTISDVTKDRGFAYGNLPISAKEGYNLEGWYTSLDYNEKVTNNYIVTEDVTLYAKWVEVTNTCEDHVNTTMYHSYECPDNNVAVIDGKVCKRATMLHEEICSGTSGGCYAAGYSSNGTKRTNRIVYGNCGTNGVLTPGDAFTCDVNGDGIFDEYSERFYYMGNYYDTSTKTIKDDTASLVYFTTMYEGKICNGASGAVQDKTSSGNTEMIASLPTREQWPNVTPKINNKQIIDNQGNNHYNSFYYGKSDYSNSAARLLNSAELSNACGVSTFSVFGDFTMRNLCDYFLESTKYYNYNNGPSTMQTGYWLETPYSNNGASQIMLSATGYTNYVNRTYTYGIKPVIDVPIDSIQYGANPQYYTVTYVYNGGTESYNYVGVERGEAVGTLPSTSKTDHNFLGWYTGMMDGIKVDSSFTPTSDVTLYAMFESKTKYPVHFDTQGGDPIDDILVSEYSYTGTLPTPTRDGYSFAGWYKDPEYETSAGTTVLIKEEITLYAKWTKTYTLKFVTNGGQELNDVTVYENNNYYLSNPQREGYVFLGWYEDAELTNKVPQTLQVTHDMTLYAKWYEATTCAYDKNYELMLDETCPNNQDIVTSSGIICQRAKVLHQEKCNSNSCRNAGYKVDGSKGTDVITYGKCGTAGTLTYGDAFTCDINGDGEFNELSERFYYLGTDYNTYTKKYDTDTAVLMYYNNVKDGLACNNATRYKYSSGSSNSVGPTAISVALPTTDQWVTELKYTNRQILNQKGVATSSSNYLPIFSFEGKAARLAIYQDITRACPLGNDGGSTGALNNCPYVMENTGFAGNYGGVYMLDTPCNQDNSYVWGLSPTDRYFGNMYASSATFSPRPVIEIPLNAIDYGQEEPYYKITFDVNGGNLVNNYSAIKENTAIGDLPTPTRELFRFVGWYTGITDGTKIESDYVVTGPMKLYAHWEDISYVNIDFETNGGTDVDSISLEVNKAIGNLPYTNKEGYILEGWYTTNDYIVRITPESTFTTDVTLYARWKEIDSCDNNVTITQIHNNTCSNNQNIILPDGAVCKRASILHQETCQISTTAINKHYCEGDGYYANGSKGTNIITYGSCGTDGELNVGDAFTCDVNGDGEFDEYSERFYYISDYYNTYKNDYDSNIATLVYYSDTYQGKTCNNEKVAYGTRSYHDGPNNAYKQLPSNSQWVNTPLTYSTRQITTTTGTTQANSQTLPEFNYSGYNARLLTYKEIYPSCNSNISNNCNFLLENTSYSTTNLTSYYLESVDTSSTSAQIRYLYTYTRVFNNYTYNTAEFGVRPTIEVPKSKIAYGGNEYTSQYKVSFDPNGGDVNQAYSVTNNGEAIGELPVPTQYLATFTGWYTGLTDGIKVDETYTPTANTTLYAHWDYHPYYTIQYVTGEGSNIEDFRIEQNIEIGDLPKSVRPGYLLEGWYLESTYDTRVLPDYIVSSDITLYAKWITSVTCYNNNDVTSIHNNICENNINIQTNNNVLCRRATTLHEETCNQYNNSSACAKDGLYTQSVKYGTCGTDGELNVGDAFTCDVNGDGEFNELTERFYYISDYYDTVSKEFDSSVASLIFYNDIYNGLACNQTGSSYNSYSYYNDLEGPKSAAKHLASDTLWINNKLYNKVRQISNNAGETEIGSTVLPTFNYNGYTSRLLTINELKSACGSNNISTSGYLDTCKFLVENTTYTNFNLLYSYWLENYNTSVSEMMMVNGPGKSVSYTSYYNATGVRPVIDVPKGKLSIGGSNNYVTINLDSNGGDLSKQFVSIEKDNQIGTLPEPTYTDKEFDGWYTSLIDGTKIDSNYVVTTDITLYAKWK